MSVKAKPESSVFHSTLVGVFVAVAYWSVVSCAAICGKVKKCPPALDSSRECIKVGNRWDKY